MHKRIMNIVNFVRGIEPRCDMDLFTPVAKQLELTEKYEIPTTFLLQYDAMMREDFRTLFCQNKSENTELGVWFENCRALIEKIGLVWRGREGYDWDWFVNPGFLMGYTPAQREAIIDEVFRYFKEIFGYYPEVVGSWLLDAYSMKYMSEKYPVKAFCICREQWSTDAYALWGGYYNGGYYPSENNMLCPAQTKEKQIDVPVFRMLGIDPIYGYDERKYQSRFTTGCWTLEPAWPSGCTPDVVDWYLKEYYTSPCLAFAEMTTGQENSFGWENFGNGYVLQIEKLLKCQAEGKVVIEKLGDTGVNFKKSYAITPPQALTALSDWSGNGIKTVWYNCNRYRANAFFYKGQLFLRDMTLFHESYKERYLDKPCDNWEALYDNLPVIDARLWSKNKEDVGLYLKKEVTDIDISEVGDTIEIKVFFQDGAGRIRFRPDAIEFTDCGELLWAFGDCSAYVEITRQNNALHFIHNGFGYSVAIYGEVCDTDNGVKIDPIGNTVRLDIG